MSGVFALFSEILIWLLIALALGALIAWLWMRVTAKSRAEEQTAPWRDKVAALERERDRLRRESGETRDDATERETQLIVLREDLQQRETTIATLTRDIEALRDNRPVPEPANDGQLERLRSELAEAHDRLSANDARVAELTSALQECRDASARSGVSSRGDKASRKGSGNIRPTSSKTPDPAPSSADNDDLTRIKGIGKVIEAKLRKLGISTYAQIAQMTEVDIDRVNDQLAFKGRIERERWVDQARDLMPREQ